jgi:ubiquinone/menaquinone biosynthesis C-methylase UbiE
VERCAPLEVQGIDPSEGQLAFARKRPAARIAKLSRGDAMALPFPPDTFDAATMALVISFVPDPIKGVAEMVRVIRPGGSMRLKPGKSQSKEHSMILRISGRPVCWRRVPSLQSLQWRLKISKC